MPNETETVIAVTAKLLNFSAEDWGRHRLNEAFEAFQKHPNSGQWFVMRRAMLVYQQAMLGANRHSMNDLLRDKPPAEWDSIIVKTGTGITLDEQMTEAEYECDKTQ
jgi:hypothetical protein